MFAGPAEASEPEIKNELWIADKFTNIKFSNNIHSFGGYFMWAPGTYLPDRGEGDAVHANIGVEKYFFAAGDRILNRIKEVRNTVILPERTGPDRRRPVLGRRQQRRRALVQPRRHRVQLRDGRRPLRRHALNAAAAVGATGVRLANRNGFDAGDKIIDRLRARRTRRRGSSPSVTRQNPPSPAPNVTLTEPLTQAHAAGEPVAGGTTQVGVGFQPPYETEGKYEALEFAAGNLRPARVGVRLRARHDAAEGADDERRPLAARRSRRRSSSSTSRR